MMTCEEKARFAAEYESTAGKFSAGVTELNQRIGISLKEEYERLDRVEMRPASSRSKHDWSLNST